MKKNISINISGIIFHIEEDGFDRLKSYLESINRYFSNFDDSKEIIADIENRIAEIFLAKLSDGKQVVTHDDVEVLISTMGTVEDFEAAEEYEDQYLRSDANVADNYATEDKYSQSTTTEQPKTEKRQDAPKKLLRDESRKLLGGVAAGIAHYFAVDPLWIRLILVLVFLNVINMSISGGVLLAYIIMWIVVPGTKDLEEDKSIKKLFRDPDQRVLGGVSGGIAKYFGVDIIVIRLLFIAGLFLGGSGFILYIVLWMITPEAKSITDKMQMQGEPVTLSNIEANVKRSLNVQEGEENIATKIILFPFRLVATVFKGLGNALGPIFQFLVEAVRILAGFILFITGISLLMSILFSGGALFSLRGFHGMTFAMDEYPIELIRELLPPYAIMFSVILIAIPALMLTLLGLAIMAKRRIIASSVGWGLFAIWIVSIVGAGMVVPGIVTEFKAEGTHREEVRFNLQDYNLAHLNMAYAGDDKLQNATLRLRGHDQNDFLLEKRFEARGRSRNNAIENAQMMRYSVAQQDSVLVFDSHASLEDDTQFRMHELSMILYIPYDYPFTMSDNLREILRSTIYTSGYTVDQIPGNTWIFTEAGLKCVTCSTSSKTSSSSVGTDANFPQSGHSEKHGLSNFDAVRYGSNFRVFIKPGNEHAITLNGRRQDVEKTNFKVSGNELKISYDQNWFSWGGNNKIVNILIESPEVNYIKASGASETHMSGFNQSRLEITTSGAADCTLEGEYELLEGTLSGASTMTLSGKGNSVEFTLRGASSLKAENYETNFAEVTARGASSAKLTVLENIEHKTSGAANVDYIKK